MPVYEAAPKILTGRENEREHENHLRRGCCLPATHTVALYLSSSASSYTPWS